MSTTARDGTIRIESDASGAVSSFDRALQQMEQSARRSGSQLQKSLNSEIEGGLTSLTSRIPVLGGVLAGLSGPALAGAAAVAAVGTAFVAGVRESNQYAEALYQLQGALNATGNATGLSIAQLRDQASAIEDLSLNTEESVLKAQAVLARFDGIAGTTFRRATSAAADYAAFTGGDLNDAIVKVGQALQGLATGDVEALSRGFKFLNQAQLDAVKQLARTGQVAEAQGAFLDLLAGRIGGAAGDRRAGLTGATFALSDAWGDLLRKLGDTGAASGATALINDLADAIKRIDQDSIDRVVNVLTFGGVAASRRARGQIGSNEVALPAASVAAAQEVERRRQDAAARTAAEEARRAADEARAAERRQQAADEAARQGAARRRDEERRAEAAERAHAAARDELATMEAQARVARNLAAIAQDATLDDTARRRAIEDISAARAVEVERTQALARLAPQLTAEERRRLDLALAQKAAAEGATRDAERARADAADRQRQIDDEAQRSIEDQRRRAEVAQRDISDVFYDLFSGRVGDIWDRFKATGLSVLADVAAAGVLNPKGGLAGAFGAALQGQSGAGLFGAVASGIFNGGVLNSGGLAVPGIAGGLFGSGAASAAPGLFGASALGQAATAPAITGLFGAGATAAGSAAAAALPAIGLAIAGVSLLGKLFGKTPKSSATLTLDEFGAGVGTVTGTSAGRRDQARQLGGGLADAVNQLADALDVDFGSGASVSIGTRKKKFVVDPTGSGRTKGSGVLKFDSEQEALKAALRDAIADGALDLSSQDRAILLRATDIDKAAGALATAKAAAKELADLRNPISAAVRQLDEDFQRTQRLYRQFGIDITDTEALYVQKRKKALEDALAAELGGLTDLHAQLTTGDLSGQSTEEKFLGARAAYDRARAGTDNAAFARAAADFANANVDYNASSVARFDIQSQIVAEIDRRTAAARAQADALSAPAIGSAVGTAVNPTLAAGFNIVGTQIGTLAERIAGVLAALKAPATAAQAAPVAASTLARTATVDLAALGRLAL